MARGTRSQWDFGGDLFPASAGREVWSVSDLTGRVKRLLGDRFPAVWVRGEVSNWRLQSSGHAYFVLKDAGAQLACVLFRGESGVDRALFRDGAALVLGGAVTVYEARGAYQLRVTAAEAEGQGALQAAFERLKRKLDAEGLFAPDRKRPIPVLPRRIGVVTSPTGAALRDVLHVVARRFAGLEIVLAPVRVQGAGAASEIAEGIRRLNRHAAAGGGLDAILLTRGGGSLEDLWAFNEEEVARAIAASELPVVSAVGHEIDFTIADFVADLRAATPSAGAEILTAAAVQARVRVDSLRSRLGREAHAALADARVGVERIHARLSRVHPRRTVEARGQELDDLTVRMVRAARRSRREPTDRLRVLVRRWVAAAPRPGLALRRRALAEPTRRLVAGARSGLEAMARRVERAAAALALLSPQEVLARGYSITFDASTGAVVRDAAGLAAGMRLRTRLARGELGSVVTSVVPAGAPPPTPG